MYLAQWSEDFFSFVIACAVTLSMVFGLTIGLPSEISRDLELLHAEATNACTFKQLNTCIQTIHSPSKASMGGSKGQASEAAAPDHFSAACLALCFCKLDHFCEQSLHLCFSSIFFLYPFCFNASAISHQTGFVHFCFPSDGFNFSQFS